MLNNLNTTTNTPKTTQDKKIDSCLQSLSCCINCVQNQITDLSQSIATECAIIDNASVDAISARTADISATLIAGQLVTCNGQVSCIVSDHTDTDYLVANTIDSEHVCACCIDTDNLVIRNAISPTSVCTPLTKSTTIWGTDGYICNIAATCMSAQCAGIVSADIGNVNTCCICAFRVEASNCVKALDVCGEVTCACTLFSNSAYVRERMCVCGCAVFTECATNVIPYIQNQQIEGVKCINVQPNIDIESQWVTLYIDDRNVYNNTTLINGQYTVGTWPDSETKQWSLSVLASHKSAMIAWDQDALETIREISFEKDTGNIAIKVRAHDYIKYHSTYLKGTTLNTGHKNPALRWQVNGPGYEEIYVPNTLAGYTFESYNDSTTSFYFGGQVDVNTLHAVIQEFDWATYKNIGIQYNLRVPIEYNPDDGSVQTWQEGSEGQYLTVRPNTYTINGTTTTVNQLVWEDPLNNTSQSAISASSHLVTANALGNYNGEIDGCHNIVHLGDGTTVHGSARIYDNLLVGEDIKSQHFAVSNDTLEDTGIHIRQGYDEVITATDVIEIPSKNFRMKTDGSIYSGNYASLEYGLTMPLGVSNYDYNMPFRLGIKGGELYVVQYYSYSYNDKKGWYMDKVASITKASFTYARTQYEYIRIQPYSISNRISTNDISDPPTELGFTLEITDGWTHAFDIEDMWQNKYATELLYARFVTKMASLSGEWKAYRTNASGDEHEVAVYDNTTLENNKPFIYNSDTNAIRTTDTLDVDSISADDIIANTIHATEGFFTKVTTTEEETISTGSDNVVLRQNNSTKLKDGQLSGIIVNNYDGNGKVAIVGSDNDGTVRVGTAETATHSYADIYYKDGKYYSYNDTTDTYTELTPGGELVAYDSKTINDDDYTKYTNAVFAVFGTSNTVPLAARDEESNMSDQSLTIWDASTLTFKTIPRPSNAEDVLVPYFENNKLTYRWDAKKAGVYTFATKAEYMLYAANNNIPNDSIITITGENNYIYSEDK